MENLRIYSNFNREYSSLQDISSLHHQSPSLPPVTGPENKKDNDDAEEDEHGDNGADLRRRKPGCAKLLQFLDLPKLPLVSVALHSNRVEVQHLASLVLDEVEQRPRLTGAVVWVPASWWWLCDFDEGDDDEE